MQELSPGWISEVIEPDAPFLEVGLDSLVLTQAAMAVSKRFGVKVTLPTAPRGALHCRGRWPSAWTSSTLRPRQSRNPSVARRACVGHPGSWRRRIPRQPPRPWRSRHSDVERRCLARRARARTAVGGDEAAARPCWSVRAPPALRQLPRRASAGIPAPDRRKPPSSSERFRCRRPRAAKASSESTAEARIGAWKAPDKQRLGGLGAEREGAPAARSCERYIAAHAGLQGVHGEASAAPVRPARGVGFPEDLEGGGLPDRVSARSSGSKIWDVDGNEYVDMVMGFGTTYFGHSPEWIHDAIREPSSAAGSRSGRRTSSCRIGRGAHQWSSSGCPASASATRVPRR